MFYIILASKGHPQHLCDCSDHPDWNGGWIRTDLIEVLQYTR